MWRGGRQETRNILLAPLGQGRGKGALPFPRDKCKGSLPGQNPGPREGAGIRERKRRARGKECHTNTASCKEELDPLELHGQCSRPLQAPAVGEEKALSPGPPLRAAAGRCQCYSLRQGLFLESANSPPAVGLHPLSKAPSEYARTGTEQHLSTPRGFHPEGIPWRLTCGGQHVGCHRAS